MAPDLSRFVPAQLNTSPRNASELLRSDDFRRWRCEVLRYGPVLAQPIAELFVQVGVAWVRPRWPYTPCRPSWFQGRQSLGSTATGVGPWCAGGDGLHPQGRAQAVSGPLARGARAGDNRQGSAVQVEPMKFMLKAPGTKRLKLKYDEPLSTVSFNLRLRRYSEAQSVSLLHEQGGVRYLLNLIDTPGYAAAPSHYQHSCSKLLRLKLQ